MRRLLEGACALDTAILTPVSLFLGALIGGGASLCAAVYTQRHQDRLRRIAGEIAKREAVYADFVMSASNVLLHAFTHDDVSPCGDEQRLIGLINRMRLFAPHNVVSGAEAVLRAIVEIALRPSIELPATRQLRHERAQPWDVVRGVAGPARSGVALEERRSVEKLPLTIGQTRRAPRMRKILDSLLARIAGKQGGVVGTD